MNQLLAQRIPSQLNIKINLGARRDVDIWTMAMVNTSEMRQTLPPQRRSSHLTPPANKHREQPSSANGPGQGWRSPNAKHIPRWCFSAAVDYRFTRQRYVYSCSQNGNNKKKKTKSRNCSLFMYVIVRLCAWRCVHAIIYHHANGGCLTHRSSVREKNILEKIGG